MVSIDSAMTIDDMPQRQTLISGLISQGPEQVANITLQSWKSMASELIPLIGKDGFAILFDRSLYITQSSFPWLAYGQAAQPADPEFTSLKMSLEGRDLAEAAEASEALLATFVNLLETLIGERLTARILRSALGDGDSAIDSKEPRS
jgi:hypothetical protein